jgi:PAS domain S-box-containing protein
MRFRKFIGTHFTFIISGLCLGSSAWIFFDLVQKTSDPWFLPIKILLALMCLSLLALFARSMIISNVIQEKKEHPHSSFFEGENFKASNPMICVFDLHGNYLKSNFAWDQVTGLKPELCTDMGWLQVIHADDRQKFLELWQIFLDGESGFFIKHRLKTNNGSLRTVISTATPCEKDIKLYVCDITDITEANLLLNQLKDGLDRSTIIAMTDEKGVITYANKAFCKISKFDERELLGKTHRLINSSTHEKNYFKDMWRTIIAGEVWVGEVCNRAKDGTLYWTHAVIIPFLNESKKPFQYLALRIEITKRKKQELLYQAISEVFQAYTANHIEARIIRLMVEKAQSVTRSSIGFLGIQKDNRVYIFNICQAHKTTDTKKIEYLAVKENFFETNPESILGWTLTQNKAFIIKENGRFPYPFGGNINNIKIHSFLGIPFQFARDSIAYLGLANSDSPYEMSTIEELEPLIQSFSQILTDVRAQEIREELTAQIQNREKSLNTFIGHLPSSIAMLDSELNFVNTSGKWIEDYQVGNLEILNKNLFSIITA